MNKNKRNTAFYIEIIALLVLLLLGISVLVQVFGSAQKMGREAKELTSAIPIAHNVGEIFSASKATTDMVSLLGGDAEAINDKIIAYYTKDSTPTTKDNAYFVMEMSISKGEITEKALIKILRNDKEVYTIKSEIYRR